MTTQQPSSQASSGRRTRLVRPYPVRTLPDALAVAETIQEANAGLPFDRLLLAKAMGTTAASSGFTTRLSASARYGLTVGGYRDPTIELTGRGEAIVAPQGIDEQRQALVDCALQPELFRRFYEALDGRAIPADQYAQNMLQREMGVHPGLTSECLASLTDNGAYAGIVLQRHEGLSVDLAASAAAEPRSRRPSTGADTNATSAGRLFVAHSNAADVAEHITRFLADLGIECDVAEIEADGGTPIDEDTSRRMRACSAAILVQGQGPTRSEGTAALAYQLGAASVLYGERIVLLREFGQPAEGVPAPKVRTLEYERQALEALSLRLLLELKAVEILRVDIAPQ